MKTSGRSEAESVKAASRKLLRSAWYDATISEASEGESRRGNDMIKISVVVDNGAGEYRTFTFSPPGRNPLPSLVRAVRQSFDWTRRLVTGVCCNTVSLLLGAALAALFGLGVVAGIGGAMVGIAPEPELNTAVSRLFPNLVAEAPHTYSQRPASRDWLRRDRPAPEREQFRPADIAMAGRLCAFGLLVIGFYGAYRSGNRLEKWWNGTGKFPLAPKGKTALEFSGFALLALLIGLAGAGLIGSSVEALTGNDAWVLTARGARDPFPGRSGPVSVESLRSGALTGFCIGQVLVGGFVGFVGWCLYRMVKGLRSLFRPAQSSN